MTRTGITTRRRLVIAMISLVLIGAGTAALGNDGLRWRLQVVALKAGGQLDDITWSELAAMLQPGSLYYLEPLTRDPNPFQAIRNPYTSQADSAAGMKIFAERCAPCHESHGTAVLAPDLGADRLELGDSDWALYRSSQGGIEGRTMPPTGLSERELWQVVTYVHAMRVSAQNQPREPDFVFPHGFIVSADRLEKGDTEPENWLTHAGSYRSWRYSSLDEVNTANAAELKLAWAKQLRGDETIEATPIVVDGVMYLSEPPSNVVALDAATGETIWRYTRTIPVDVPSCCGRPNRGVAILDDKVYVGTFDGYLVALDSKTGLVDWTTRVAEYAEGYSITAAPLALDGKIVVGVAGGEFGIRGFLDAYDAETGSRVWRFYTIPAPGEPGAETWASDGWRSGGGPTWVTGSYDPIRKLVYWGVGNPWPDFDGGSRPGDNLYTNSVIALDADTGELVWHFQFTPHDVHDWDSNQTPVLVDVERNGATSPLMLWANRNGFYYVLDRETGRFLHATPYVRQDWAEAIDENGRPKESAHAAPTERGTSVWPGPGGTNWWSPSYSPMANLFYVPFVEGPKVFIKNGGDDVPVAGGPELLLGGTTTYTGVPFDGGVRALDPLTGARRWQYLSSTRTISSAVGGILTTAGNVLFFGDLETFVALDSASGEELLRINLGGTINAAPSTFVAGGHQMISIASGSSLYTFRL